MSLLDELTSTISYSKVERKIVDFIRDYVYSSSVEGVVLGLSGGVDSSVTATLLVKSLGRNNVLALIMPHSETSKVDVEDAISVAKMLNIEYKVINIDKCVDVVINSSPWLIGYTDKVVKGNIIARIRMIILYHHANALKRLVAGTSDRSEYLLGYFTKHGDGAADFFPLLDLYKTQVRKLAYYLGLPKRICEKPSSPGLWRDHLAIEELGFNYGIIDQVLYGYFDKKLPINEIAEKVGLNVEDVKNILNRIKVTEHKRVLPPHPKLRY